MSDHTVSGGDCFASIARAHGFFNLQDSVQTTLTIPL